MFLGLFATVAARNSFPRIRGDVPFSSRASMSYTRFSPHTRGCSYMIYCNHKVKKVFPAYAGMFLATISESLSTTSFPRIRGDVPHQSDTWLRIVEFSPHTRGCSAIAGRFADDTHVFPAYAGMFQMLKEDEQVSMAFSPHTRGCSTTVQTASCWGVVFPAYAGMFRSGTATSRSG